MLLNVFVLSVVCLMLLTFSEYCNIHKQIWTCYNSTFFVCIFVIPDVPFLKKKYDNLEVYKIRCDEFGSLLLLRFYS